MGPVDKIVVCGCGPSIEQILPEYRRYFTIGCNDCDRWFPPDHLVVGDKLMCFPEERAKIIRASKAGTVWLRNESIGHPNEKMIKLEECRNGITPEMLDGPLLSYVMTPFMAICLAYKLGAKKIGLLGVDLVRPSTLRYHTSTISAKLEELRAALEAKGTELVNLSTESAVTSLPWITLRSL